MGTINARCTQCGIVPLPSDAMRLVTRHDVDETMLLFTCDGCSRTYRARSG